MGFEVRQSLIPRHRRTIRFAWILVFACSAWVGCGSNDPGAELDALAEAGDVGAVIDRCRELLSEGGDHASIHLHLGLALLSQDEDPEALRSLRKAAERDSTLADGIAQAFAQRAMADRGKWQKRATVRMRRAYEFDHDVDLGPLADPVANAIYKDRAYAECTDLYRRLHEGGEGPPPKLQEWAYRFAHCKEKAGEIDVALEGYRAYMKRWGTESTFAHYTMRRLQSVLLDRAEAALEKGDPAGALEAAGEAMRRKWNPPLLQWGRFLVGQAHEMQDNLDAAVESYRSVVENAATGGKKQDEKWVAAASQRLADLGHAAN